MMLGNACEALARGCMHLFVGLLRKQNMLNQKHEGKGDTREGEGDWVVPS